MKRNHIKLLLLSVAVLGISAHCRKYNNFDTIIELVIPEECKDNSCSLFLLEKEFDELEEEFHALNYFDDVVENEEGEMTVQINWTEWDDIIDPRDPINFYLVNLKNNYTSIKDADFYYESGLQKLVPSKIYYWEPEKEIFEYTGEKTDNKNGGGSSECFVGNWTSPNAECINSINNKINIDGDGTLVFKSPIYTENGGNCDLLCTVTFNISWKKVSEGSMKWTYNKISNDCGEDNPSLPDPETVSYSCDGSTLKINGKTYSK